MHVLVADAFEESGLTALKAAGCDVLYQPDLKDGALADAIRTSGAEVLIVRSTKVTEAMLDAGRLALVVRAGAGYNTIDVKAASARGIYVSNCPGKNAIAVAELTFALLLAIDRRVADNVADLRSGTWNKKLYAQASGLAGKTIGIAGAGAIAREVIRRARAFDMPVILWSRRFDGRDDTLTAEECTAMGFGEGERDMCVRLAPSLVELAARSDVLSLHLALSPETKHTVGPAVLARLKPGAILINTARGELIDHAALAEAVRTRGLRVGLDVFEHEPDTATGTFHDPVAQLPGVYGTHHIGASTSQAQEAIAAETVRIVRAFAETGRVPNVVNLARRTPATHMLVVRHHDRPGVLAHVFGHLREKALNVQETENIVFEGALAAVARINLDKAPDAALLDSLRASPDVLDLQVVPL
jgi:D-3-phosphoglycerate dehydrogenase / 2-oxoglutarate reductase